MLFFFGKIMFQDIFLNAESSLISPRIPQDYSNRFVPINKDRVRTKESN